MIYIVLLVLIGVYIMRYLQNKGQVGMFVIGHNAYWEPDFLTSPNGITWTERSAGLAPTGSSDIWHVCWSPDLGKLVAVCSGGATVARSTDGITWDTDLISDDYFQDIVWSPELGLFCTVGRDVFNNVAYIKTSPDGITWTARTPITTYNSWESVCWSPELALFVAVGTDTGVVMTSPDGTNWTQRAGATGGYREVCWSPELSLFVAVGYRGTGYYESYVMTSPDGVTWTARTPPTNPSQYTTWNGVAWSPELGLFAACATTGDHRFMTSPDGITWTVRTDTKSGDSVYREVCWSSELSLFVAVGSGGSWRIQYSPDGINWTAVAHGYANWSIIWAA